MQINLSGVTVKIPGRDLPLFRIKKLEILGGSRMLIHGKSGVGKTTLLHLVAGLFLPAEGDVSLDGKNLRGLTESERCLLRRQHFGLMFQKLNLIDHLTGWENVRLGVFGQADPSERTSRALHRVGADSYARQLSGNLSMGEQQRLAAARVLAAQPDIALIDEPTSSLDQENADLVMDALLSLPASTTIIIVSHDQRIRDRFTLTIPFEKLVDA